MLDKRKNHLFLLHFAGGSSYSYNIINEEFINDINVSALELPGRGKRINQNMLENYEEAVNDYFIQIEQLISNSKPYFIFGHSMGALLSYSVCQKLQEKNLPLPVKLIVSGKKAPNIPRKKKISHLADEEFWKEIIALGGIPDELMKYPELIEYYIPILRHDFKLIENYLHQKKDKLNIPIDVFYGSEEATEEEMIGWQEESNGKVTITKLEGNHFFIFNHIDYFKNYFKNLMETKTIIHSYV